MINDGTPVEAYPEYKLYVKREDLSCSPPGPPFSKMRGVIAHVRSRKEHYIGVLDTYHSQAGHAVAAACHLLGKTCLNYYPEYKHEPGWREPQQRAKDLGAILKPLPAGMSAVLWHQARKDLTNGFASQSYMMPNALKLTESIRETAAEVARTKHIQRMDVVVVPASSATIATGVIQGLHDIGRLQDVQVIVHLGYSRPIHSVYQHIALGLLDVPGEMLAEHVLVIDEGYSYKDKARFGEDPSWPCNEYYDLKAFRWLMKSSNIERSQRRTLLWNIG